MHLGDHQNTPYKLEALSPTLGNWDEKIPKSSTQIKVCYSLSYFLLNYFSNAANPIKENQ